MSEMKTALDRMRERAEEAERKLEEARSHEYLLGWRSLDADDGCKSCGGSGVRAYSTTATWRGVAGGATITNDVCNACWGSGSRTNKWPSHRSFDRMRERAEQAERERDEARAQLAKWLKWAEDEGRPALVKLTALEKHERSADQ